MSTKSRHSYVPFYMADWMAGTSRMPRLIKAVYFDLCLYTWDTARKVPKAELVLMLADLAPGQGDQIIDALVDSGKLQRDEDTGAVWSHRALAEAEKAFDLWQRKSKGGKSKAALDAEQKDSKRPPAIDQEQDQEQDLTVDREGSPPLGKESEKSDLPRPAHPENTPEYLAAVDGLVGKGTPKPAKPEKPRPTAGQCAEVIGAWNEMASANSLAQAVKMTGAREGAARVRLEEMGIEQILEAIALVPQRPFLMGKNERGWKADIDWFLRPNSPAKVLEGTAYMDAGKGSAWREME